MVEAPPARRRNGVPFEDNDNDDNRLYLQKQP